jgi:hypothetical protein
VERIALQQADVVRACIFPPFRDSCGRSPFPPSVAPHTLVATQFQPWIDPALLMVTGLLNPLIPLGPEIVAPAASVMAPPDWFIIAPPL